MTVPSFVVTAAAQPSCATEVWPDARYAATSDVDVLIRALRRYVARQP